MSDHTAEEMMAVAAARRLRNGIACFVGIGLPSKAANLARATHAPDCVLIYESGTIGAKPQNLPLSIGDGELAETADAVIGVPEVFSYWLQGGRIDVGFLGAAQIDRYANLNSTVIGPYDHPKVRLPGGGGAPEISASCKETLVILKQSSRTFVEELAFRTSVGFGDGPGSREALGLTGRRRERGDHRSGGARARSRDVRADAHPHPSGSDRAAGGGRHRVAAQGCRRRLGQPAADRRRARGAARASHRRGGVGGHPGRARRRRRRRHGAFAVSQPRLPLVASAGSPRPADHAAGRAARSDRACVWRGAADRGRRRPHSTACRRAAGRADHRHRAGARLPTAGRCPVR